MDKVRRQLGRLIVREREASALAVYLKTADAKELSAAWKSFISSISHADTVDLHARGHDNLPTPGMCDAEKMMLLFIQAGADIHHNYSYATPIMKCADYGWMTALDELVARGASTGAVTVQVSTVFVKRQGGPTLSCGSPMHRAAQGGHIAIMERLLSLGAAVDDADGTDQTPLFRAVAGKHLAAMEWLVDHGADVLRISHGQNMLHALANTVHLDYSEAELESAAKRARWLIERGVDPALRDGGGNSPISIATRSERPHVAMVMKAIAQERTLDQEITASAKRKGRRI